MLIEYIVLFLLGIAAGVAAGLLPGLHVNNIGAIAMPLMAASGVGLLPFAVFLTAMATSQGFLNFIPAIFLGAPDESTVLSVLPTNKMLLSGRGKEAVKLTGKASLYGVFLSLLFLPSAFVIVPLAYSAARFAVVPILIFAISFLILRERKAEKILFASATFFISGYLGWTCLNVKSLSTGQVFLPLFSGLFGLGSLLTGMTAQTKSYPQDEDDEIRIGDRSLWRNSLLGTVGAIIVGLLPAMSPSQIGIVFQEISAFKGRVKERLEDLHVRQFITMVAALNTADALFSIFGVYLMGNPRSGVSVIIQDMFGSLDIGVLALLCFTMLLSGLISYSIHIFIGERFAGVAGRIDFRKLSAGAFAFVIVLVFATTGPFGLLIAAVSTAVGLVPALTGVSRTHCMGCLLLPTLLFFIGMG